MSKLSFYRTLLIMVIIFIGAIDFCFYYSAVQMEKYSEQFIKMENEKVDKIKEHRKLTSTLNDILTKVIAINKEIDGGIQKKDLNFPKLETKILLQKEKIKAMRIRSQIVNEYNDLTSIDQKHIIRINHFYTKGLSALTRLPQDVVLNTQKIETFSGETFKSKNVGIIGVSQNIPTYKQKLGANTCVIDSIGLTLKFLEGKELNKSYAYSIIDKKLGDMWQTGLYYVGPNGEGYLSPMSKGEYLLSEDNTYIKKGMISVVSAGADGEYLDKEGKKYTDVHQEANDFERIRKAGILSYDGNTYGKMAMYLDWKMPVVMEVPMSVLYPNQKKWETLKIWHAISVFGIDTDTDEIIYSNTLSGRIERLKIDSIRSSTDKRYLKYPFHIIAVEKGKESSVFN